MTATWRIDVRPAPTLPALCWLARIRAGQVSAQLGQSVRGEDAGFFEGTWAGPPALSSLATATTVFGSGIVLDERGALVITPSHHLEGVYAARTDDALVLSNSFVAVLVAAGLELDPDLDYPAVFTESTDICWLIQDDSGRLLRSSVTIPTRTGDVSFHIFENLRIDADGSLTVEPKQRERAFASFADYRERLTSMLASAISNSAPREPVVALSSGYDSTGVAAVAANIGTRRAVGLRTSRPSPHDGSVKDSGEQTAALLGLDYELFDRLAYQRAPDLPEAEFLANGMTGEDIIFKAFEPRLRRTCFMSGYWAGTQWALAHENEWRRIAPTSTAGADMGEFRLRNDFHHVLPAVFGAVLAPGAPRLLDRREMDPFRIGGHYDRPIPRRLAEEAGIPRESFGHAKRAANALFQRDGLAAFSEPARRAVAEFAAAEGKELTFRRRRRSGRWERALIQAVQNIGLGRLVTPLDRRRKRLVHFDRGFGNIVFRWAVSVVRPRYAALGEHGE